MKSLRRRNAGAWLLAVLFFGSAPVAAEGEKQGSQWIVGRTKLEPGEAVFAWLPIAPDANAPADSTTEIQLYLPDGMKAWAIESGTSCPSEGASDSVSFDPQKAFLAHYCFRFAKEPGGRAVATYPRVGKSRPTIAATPSFVVENPPTHPMLFPIVTASTGAVLGLFAGVLSSILKTSYDRRREARVNVEAMSRQIVEKLLGDLPGTRQTLKAAAGGAQPTTVSVGGLHSVWTDQGIVGFLTEQERRAYFAKIERIFDSLNHYNSQVNQQGDAKKIAKGILSDLNKLLGKK